MIEIEGVPTMSLVILSIVMMVALVKEMLVVTAERRLGVPLVTEMMVL